ncbi:MAG TPA: peptidoglycan editing factor PgeF [Candidatus Krumholzibacteria bacterium]|nr:peptidoglycan editing factor PgeF [Candidatus Krumholzibacteria bacterium]
MIEQSRNDLRFFESELLAPHPQVEAVVSTRRGGVSTGAFASLNLGGKTADAPDNVRENRRRVAALFGRNATQLTFARQVHGAHIAHVPAGHPGGAFDNVDALITDAKDTPLVILTADCAAIFMYDVTHHAIGIAHAGWRGTVAQIAAHTVQRMHAVFGTEPREIVACVGPSIGPCCYEVGEEVIAAVIDAFPDDTDELLLEPEMASAGSFRASVNEDHKHFDLWRANERVLISAGVPDTQVEVSRLCTACHTDLFYSHRAEKGVTGRFGGVMMLR